MSKDFEKYKYLFDTIDLGIVYQDAEGKIIEVNKAAESILGIKKEKLFNLNSLSKEWKAIKEDGSPFPGEEHPAMQALASGEKINDIIMGVFNPEKKSTRWININSTPEFKKGEDKPFRVYTLFSDITEQHELKINLNHYKIAVENSTNAVGMSTPEGEHYYQNRAFTDLFGEIGSDPPSTLYVDGKVGREVFKTIMKGEEWIGEVKMFGKEGNILTIKLRAYAIKDVHNTIIGLVGVHNDITRQIQAERELKENEAMLRMALEGAKADSWIMNLPTQEIFFSETWAGYFGYTVDEIPKTILGVREVIHPDDVERNQENLNKHISGEKELYESEVRIRNKDGNYSWVLIRGKIIERNGQGIPLKLIGTSFDITEQQKTNKALNESKERLKIALEGARACSWDLNFQTGELFFSEEWLKMYGDKKGKIPTNIEDISNLLHPGDSIKNKERLEMHVMGKTPAYESETRVKNKDGSYFWMLSRGRVSERDVKGNPIKVAGVNLDITELKIAREALLESEEKFKQLAEESPNMIFINQSGKIVYANKTCERLTKYKIKEFYSPDFNFMDLIDKDYHDIIQKNFALHMEGKDIPPNEYKLSPKTGKKLSVIINTKLIQFQQREAIMGIVTDISKQKEIEETLKISEQNLQKNLAELEGIINALPGMVSVVDTEFNVLVANKEVYDKFHYSDQDGVIGRKCYETRKGLKHPCPQCGLTEAFKTGKTVTRLSTPEEEDLMGTANKAYAVPLIDKDGNIWGGVEVIMDISDLRNAERAVQASEKKFRHMIEHGGECITLMDEKGIVAYESPSVKFVTGFSPGERVGKNAIDLIHKEDKETVLKILSTIAKTPGESHTAQFRAIRKDGKIWWVNATATNMLHDPSVGALVINYRDITRQKEAEIALRESEERFRRIFEEGQFGIGIIGPELQILSANPALCQMLGYSLEEITNINFTDVIQSEQIAEFQLKIRDLVSGKIKQIKSEQEYLHKDGTLLWTSMVTSAMRDEKEKIQYFQVMIKDISELKKAGNIIQESEEKFRRIFEEGPFGIAIIGPDFKFVTVNPAFRKMMGYSAEEFQKLSFVDLSRAEKVEEYKKIVSDLKTGKIKQIKLEKEYLRKDGSYIWGSLVSTAIRDKKGDILYYLAMVKDISDLKQAEQALQNQITEYLGLNTQYKDQNKELSKSIDHINKINKELIKATQKAEESDRLKTAFLANMSHEIRTPMNGILGFTDLLSQTDLTESEHQKYLDIIQKSGNRMLSIINDLIDISKIEAGQVEIDIRPTNVNRVLDSFHAFFFPEASRRNIQLFCKKELKDVASIINTDETKFSQMLSNLIKNALKYTHDGKIEFGYQLINKKLQFYVEDTGTGIDLNSQKVIFERFRQGYHKEEENVEGSGLGLAITKAFLELLDGEIWVESEPGKGSKFFFTLPYVPVHEEHENTKKRVDLENNGKTTTILLAEDDESSQLFIKEILKNYKVKLLHAGNGQEAIALVEANPDIDLVLMDIKMPVMGGLEATRRIKMLRANLPIIAQTAFASPMDNQRAIDSGCDDYITKPIHRQLLLELINKYMNIR